MPKKEEIFSVHLYGNGNVLASDRLGRSIPAVQQNMITLWAEFAASKGYDPLGKIVVGESHTIRIIRNEDGKFDLERIYPLKEEA